MNGIVENLLAAGVLAGGQRLAEILTGGEGELRKACQRALAQAVTDVAHPKSNEQRAWLVQVIGDGLAETGAPTRIAQGGHGPLELSGSAFGRRLALGLSDELREDLTQHMDVDVDRLIERFGLVLVEEIRRTALVPRSRLQTLASRLEASQVQDTVSRVGRRVGLPDGDVEQRLAELERRSHDRVIRALEAIGIPDLLAAALATELAIPDASNEDADAALRVISAEVGSGKSTQAERLHLAAIERARSDMGARLPLFLEARDVQGDLENEVERWWHREELADRGLDLVVDGLEEVGSKRAAHIVLDVRSILRRWSSSRALLVQRPIALAVSEGAKVPVTLLQEEAAIALVARVAGRTIQPATVHGWSASAREAIRRPLFALAAGLALGSNHVLVSPIQLIDRLARHATSGVDWGVSLPVLGRAAAASVSTGHHPVPVSEVARTAAEQEILASTSLVALGNDATFTWPVVLLAEWFAAQYLLQKESLPETIVDDPDSLDRWRYALVLAAEVGGFTNTEPIVGALARRAPAMAGWVIEHAGRTVTRTTAPRYPEREWGQRFRRTMTALTDGLGPLSSVIGPVRDGRVLPLGISADAHYVALAWNLFHDAPRIGPFPKMGKPSMPSGWTSRRIIQLDSHPVFAWKTMFEQLRGRLNHALDNREMLIRPAILQAEADWCLATDLLGRRTLRTDPITIQEIQARIAPFADAHDHSSLRYGGQLAVRLGHVRTLLARLQKQGAIALTCPWPGPDRLDGIDWVPHAWSPEALRERTEQVATTALLCYKMTVDHWLPNFVNHLRLSAAWPVNIIGYLHPGDPTRGTDGWPSFIWTIKSAGDGPVAEFKVTDNIQTALENIRAIADAQSGMRSYAWGELSGIYGLTPGADLAAELLWDDLKEWDWVSGILRKS